MPRPTLVALLGFSSFERATAESFFRLAARREPAYRRVDDPALADVFIADGDDGAAIAALVRDGRLDRTLLVGGSPCPGALAQLARPINLMRVLRTLDGLALTRRPAAAGLAAAPASALLRVSAALAPPSADADRALEAQASPQVRRVLDELARRSAGSDAARDQSGFDATANAPPSSRPPPTALRAVGSQDATPALGTAFWRQD
jgi:hypothetical protein